MTRDDDGRLRLRVDHDDELSFELGTEDLGPTERARPEVRVVATSADDRASGRRRYETTIDGWVLEVSVEAEARARLRDRAGAASGPGADHEASHVRAQIPGRVVRLWVAEGDTVEAGQRLLAIEAMKMENEVRAPRSGVVGSLGVEVGDSVELADELLVVR